MNYITKHCLFCNNKEKIIGLYPQTFTEKELTSEIFSARRPVDHLHYKIVRCHNCGLVFSREILPANVLERLYSQSNITYGKYADIIRQDYWQGLKPFLAQIKKGKALEIGCGNGFFVEQLLVKGFQEVYGCEPSTAAIKTANPAIKNNITPSLFKEELYKENTFDLICSFQTLDHLPDPLESIKICHKILKPQGIAYFIVHNADSLQAKLLREKSPIINIQHIYLFNKKTLSKLFETVGFKTIKVSNLKNSYPISYWFDTLSLPKLSQVSKNLGMGLIRIPLAVGNIAIIAKCQ